MEHNNNDGLAGFPQHAGPAPFQPPLYPHHPVNVPNYANPLLPPPSIAHDQQLQESHPIISPYRMTHGPLQAERLEMQDAKALEKARCEKDKAVEKERREQKKRVERDQREKEKEEERVRKEGEKRRKEEEREKKKQEDKLAREKKAEEKEEKARKGKEKAEEKERKVKEKVEKAGKGKTAAPKSEANKASGRAAGDSDTEIEAAGKHVADGDIKPIVMNPPTKSWSEQETLDVVKYILSIWASFKLKQSALFRYVSKYVLHGSKTDEQVANQWHTHWKKFKACIHREKHTGGGDGDKLEQDANHPEPEDQDSDVEVLNDEPTNKETSKEVKKKKEKIGGFTEAQLNAFEQTKAYRLILEVVGNDPEVAKAEEFDSARPFSDSEDTSELSKSSSTKSSSSEGTEIMEKAFGILTSSMQSISKARKAAAELAVRREQRDMEAAKEEQTYWERRFNLDERRLRIDEDDHWESQWEKVRIYLKSEDDIMVRRGRRLAARLEQEELEEDERMLDRARKQEHPGKSTTN